MVTCKEPRLRSAVYCKLKLWFVSVRDNRLALFWMLTVCCRQGDSRTQKILLLPHSKKSRTEGKL